MHEVHEEKFTFVSFVNPSCPSW
ncbi:MAG: hypothetical protein QOK41_123, partial [Sphingomonadales bacterium]|nr:hypothetical protein [Sphingomonadales bacterium]